MATLVITLLLGVQGFANPCDSACFDPCSACDRGAVRNGDLFGGLKRLLNGVRINNCDPCEPVVACNPCDDVAVACNPCDDVCSLPRGGFGLFRNLFANQACTPCDSYDNGCDPCGIVVDCDPCGFADNGCATPAFRPFRNLFSGLRLNRDCFADCGPCDIVNDCGPCGFAAGNGPCDDVCSDNYCGPRGHLFELPRLNLGRLFNGLRLSRCDDGGLCNPCDEVRPCDDACCFR